jgi:hypothetical protein
MYLSKKKKKEKEMKRNEKKRKKRGLQHTTNITAVLESELLIFPHLMRKMRKPNRLHINKLTTITE